MSYFAQATMRQMDPDTQAHGYVRPDSQIQGEIESKISDFQSTFAPDPTPARGLAGLAQRRTNILAEDDRVKQVNAERARLYTGSYGPLGERLLGGPITPIG